MNEEVIAYYNNLAPNYDQDRFENSYGKFIHNQELEFLKRHTILKGNNLNLGCGTGRFMEFCSHGFDISKNMISEAKRKFPNKEFNSGNAIYTAYDSNSFDTIICLHVIMHLNKEESNKIIREALRILKPGGHLIIDHPSYKRRRLFNYTAPNWHAANEYSSKMIKNILCNEIKDIKTSGILFSPIHRFPSRLRTLIYKVDQIINKSFFKEYSSYLIHSITKK